MYSYRPFFTDDSSHDFTPNLAFLAPRGQFNHYYSPNKRITLGSKSSRVFGKFDKGRIAHIAYQKMFACQISEVLSSEFEF
jgi:hypothetical protein